MCQNDDRNYETLHSKHFLLKTSLTTAGNNSEVYRLTTSFIRSRKRASKLAKNVLIKVTQKRLSGENSKALKFDPFAAVADFASELSTIRQTLRVKWIHWNDSYTKPTFEHSRSTCGEILESVNRINFITVWFPMHRCTKAASTKIRDLIKCISKQINIDSLRIASRVRGICWFSTQNY